MPKYQRLDVFEREEISLGLAKKRSIGDIAVSLCRSKSTISREIRRNRELGQEYRVVQAQARTEILIHISRKKRKMDSQPELKEFVIEKLNNLWSPEQIEKRLKIMYPMDMTMQISHESIYSYLYVQPKGELRKELVKCLWQRHKNRRVRSKTRHKSCPIQDYLSIEERPVEVADRIIPGHWEGDLIMGNNNGSAL